MKVLVLGSGAKEHAIAWWFSKSRLIEGLYVAPGNVGTNSIAINLSKIDPANAHQVYAACIKYDIDFVFVGTEAPLFTGVIDYLNERGIKTFGAPSYALKLEGDRCAARAFAKRHNITTPHSHLFTNSDELSEYLHRHVGKSYVVKKNALSPSRVMINSSDYDQLMAFSSKMLETGAILLEETTNGIPLTVSVLLDNNGYLMLPICSEYTKSDEEDSSKATGGMGAICPIPISKGAKQRILSEIIEPTLYGMKAEQLDYKGVLTFSIIYTAEGPVLVDYHVRFNDPATQSFVPIIENDLIELMQAMLENRLNECKLEVSNSSTVCVVIASKGYPESPEINKVVSPISPIKIRNIINSNEYLFFGAVTEKSEQLITTGGRCISVVGHDNNIINANSKAYKNIDQIKFEGSWYRKDIGNKFYEFSEL